MEYLICDIRVTITVQFTIREILTVIEI